MFKSDEKASVLGTLFLTVGQFSCAIHLQLRKRGMFENINSKNNPGFGNKLISKMFLQSMSK